MSHRLAFDRSSARTIDADGRLHVLVNNISKASVNPYYGHEIPGSEELGLDPDKVYWLLRDPAELEKAAVTFNNLPILSDHVPVSAERHEGDLVIGSTGTDAAFVDPYLQNSAVIWVQDAIDDINAEIKREWSCAYRYSADMTPGKFKGLHFDGVMRNIIGNHVALVEEGRAGSDVVVADFLPKGLKMLKSRRALMLHGAISALVMPRLAQDAKIDLTGALEGVTAKNMGARATKIAAAIVKAVTPKLAADEGIDVDDVIKVIGAVQGVEIDPAEDDDLNEPLPDPDDDDTPAVDADDDCIAKVMAFLEGKLSDEDMAALTAIVEGGEAPGAEDDIPDDDPEYGKKDKPAMDKRLKAIEKQAVARFNAIRVAEREVEPFVGTIKIALDNAPAVYRLALDAAKIDLAGVPTAAYRALVKMLPLPGEAGKAPLAFDHAAGQTDFDKRFPNATTLIRS